MSIRRPSLRFSLGMLLLVVTLASLTIGIGRHFYLASQREYLVKRRVIGMLDVRGAWVRDGLGNERCLYLVVIPPGSSSLGGGGEGVFRTLPKPTRIVRGLGMYPQGLYAQANQLAGSDKGRLWVYRHATRDAASTRPDPALIISADFERIEFSPLWNEVLVHMAEEEFIANLAHLSPFQREGYERRSNPAKWNSRRQYSSSPQAAPNP